MSKVTRKLYEEIQANAASVASQVAELELLMYGKVSDETERVLNQIYEEFGVKPETY